MESRFLLLQVRNPTDPMLRQEVAVFAHALACPPGAIDVFDLLQGAPTPDELDRYDVVLLGGSGDYSVAEGGDWLPPALEAMRELHDLAKPTFASCWGFQAMARALGGEVVTDPSRAELGTVELRVTPEGADDPLFGLLAPTFTAQMGHQDIVESLPPDAVLLASSDRVRHQAFRLRDKPIYCTQFHPELTRAALIERLEAYPQYVEKISGEPLHEFTRHHCHETPACNALLRRFMAQFVEVGPESP